jgi:hypothetical protein
VKNAGQFQTAINSLTFISATSAQADQYIRGIEMAFLLSQRDFYQKKHAFQII